ncbi:hypothetical protein HJG60_008137 [Phyllostomus discolor]|uniref:Uncharacterized protein n=1 Tax=Phyllostomus discolor TaxID=89673 RepID=A0A834DP69_9CHIR|nr:hypothetical protein HJG60_008137 [Phyllostomus discolor]
MQSMRLLVSWPPCPVVRAGDDVLHSPPQVGVTGNWVNGAHHRAPGMCSVKASPDSLSCYFILVLNFSKATLPLKVSLSYGNSFNRQFSATLPARSVLCHGLQQQQRPLISPQLERRCRQTTYTPHERKCRCAKTRVDGLGGVRGHERAEDIRRGRGGARGPPARSPFPRPLLPQTRRGLGCQKQEAPAAALTLRFTVRIHHVNGVIAESRVYRPSRCGHLIHGIIRARNSPNKTTGAKRKLFH